MGQNNYKLRYLPIFEKDLKEIVFYISNILNLHFRLSPIFLQEKENIHIIESM